MEIKQEITEHLRELANGEIDPSFGNNGICGELLFRFGITGASLVGCFKSWPKYSGNFNFPVGAGSDDFLDRDGLWAENENGDLRRELCDHIADCLDAR